MKSGILTAAANARRLRESVAVAAICAMLGSCSADGRLNDYDPNGPTKKEYGDLLNRQPPAPQPGGSAPSSEPPIPDFQSVLAAPAAPELADTRRVSIAVTEATPVRDILIELTRKSNVDLEMDPRISGGVIMTATDRPLIEVIERIADLAELRYRFERNTLKVELDDPYLEQYRMDVLNLSRSATSATSSSTDASSVAQAIGSGGGGGGNNRSTTSVSSEATSDFWGTIGGNINDILGSIQSRRGGAATAGGVTAAFVPEVAPAANAAKPRPAANAGAAPEGGGAAANLLGQAAALNAGGQAVIDANVAADQPALVAGEAPEGGGGGIVQPSRYSLNRDAGIITVFANQRQQRAVERFLRDVRASVTQQVLIEAKVVEITLSDQYRAGVNWNAVFGPGGALGNSGPDNLNISTNFTRNVVPPNFVGPTLAANWMNDGDLSLAVQLVKEFGTVRTLSSPRLTALNNQVAQLKVAQNQVFFEMDVQVTEATAQNTRERLTVTSQIKTVPVGLIMSVQPAVDPVSRRISLSLRPSITRITGFVNDPGVAIVTAIASQSNPSLPAVSSPIPIIEVREMDSLISMESGQTVVMGGLMQEEVQGTREGLPGLMDVPIAGHALSSNVRQSKVTELIIFIRATLATAPGTVTDEDIRLYKKFTPDPRPIIF